MLDEEVVCPENSHGKHFAEIYSKLIWGLEKIEYKQTVFGKVLMSIFPISSINVLLLHTDSENKNDRSFYSYVAQIYSKNKNLKQTQLANTKNDEKIEKIKNKILQIHLQVEKLNRSFGFLSKKVTLHFSLNSIDDIFQEMIVRLMKGQFLSKNETNKKNKDIAIEMINEIEHLPEKEKMKKEKIRAYISQTRDLRKKLSDLIEENKFYKCLVENERTIFKNSKIQIEAKKEIIFKILDENKENSQMNLKQQLAKCKKNLESVNYCDLSKKDCSQIAKTFQDEFSSFEKDCALQLEKQEKSNQLVYKMKKDKLKGVLSEKEVKINGFMDQCKKESKKMNREISEIKSFMTSFYHFFGNVCNDQKVNMLTGIYFKLRPEFAQHISNENVKDDQNLPKLNIETDNQNKMTNVGENDAKLKLIKLILEKNNQKK